MVEELIKLADKKAKKSWFNLSYDPIEAIELYTQIGQKYLLEKNTLKAIKYLTKAGDISFEIKDNLEVGQKYLRIGWLLFKEKQKEKGTEFVLKGIKLYLEDGRITSTAREYFKLAEEMEKNSNNLEAIKYYQSGLDLAFLDSISSPFVKYFEKLVDLLILEEKYQETKEMINNFLSESNEKKYAYRNLYYKLVLLILIDEDVFKAIKKQGMDKLLGWE